ncbi:MAG TPA: hypothetical protein VK961_19645 [Chthoniobacter sp.]|nr:hypothetical protein [Chthoniobacter sp.]
MKPTQLVAMILSLVLVYVLSPGPVRFWYAHQTSGIPKVFITVYAPLSWLYDHNPGVTAAYNWYFKLWGV